MVRVKAGFGFYGKNKKKWGRGGDTREALPPPDAPPRRFLQVGGYGGVILAVWVSFQSGAADGRMLGIYNLSYLVRTSGGDRVQRPRS